MRKGSSKRLSAAQLAELRALEALPDEKIDTGDMPEVRASAGAKRGVFWRPVKQQLTIRLDADIVEWFRTHRSGGEGYQTAINRALREHVERHERKRA